jgi:hypothetical protein
VPAAHLAGREHAGQVLPLGRLVEVVGGVVLDLAGGQHPAAEDLDGGDVPCDGGGGVGAVAGEGADVVDQVGRGQGVGVGQAGVLEVEEEGVEVAGVGLEGGGEQAALDAEEDQEPAPEQAHGLCEAFDALCLGGGHCVEIGGGGAGA